MSLSERTQGRLLNWKFDQALTSMRDDNAGGAALATDAERETVEGLAACFGNCGWFDGAMANVIRAAVWFLGVTDD